MVQQSMVLLDFEHARQTNLRRGKFTQPVQNGFINLPPCV
jgi:hypothetical protein